MRPAQAQATHGRVATQPRYSRLRTRGSRCLTTPCDTIRLTGSILAEGKFRVAAACPAKIAPVPAALFGPGVRFAESHKIEASHMNFGEGERAAILLLAGVKVIQCRPTRAPRCFSPFRRARSGVEQDRRLAPRGRKSGQRQRPADEGAPADDCSRCGHAHAECDPRDFPPPCRRASWLQSCECESHRSVVCDSLPGSR